MTPSDNFYCVILAGGKGLRLWPCSRKDRPKQFVDFFGTGRTQLQTTYDRMVKIVPPERILVTTHQDYAPLVREQLPSLPERNLLPEPIHRSTAASLAWANHRIAMADPEACVVATPSDQVVMGEDEFRDVMLRGLDFAAQRHGLLAIGVKPTRPEPGYGYIQVGRRLCQDVYAVKSFTEKPERDFARMFIESGEFYWNTGLFIASAVALERSLCAIMPPVLRQFDRDHPGATWQEESEYMVTHFSLYPNISADEAILERTEGVNVMVCHFGWADLGTWHSIYEAMQKTDDDNVVVDSDVMLEDCHNNVIKLPKGRMGVINGLDGFIVAEKDKVLLICKKEDSSALIRKYVNEVQLRRGDDFV